MEDWAPIAKELFSASIETAVGEAKGQARHVAASLKGLTSHAKGRLTKSLPQYLQREAERLSNGHVPFFTDHKQYLYSFYVPIDLHRKGTELKHPNLLTLQAESNHCIILGTAGSGKSTLARHLFLSALVDSHLRTVLFIELRHINEQEKPDLIELIAKSIFQDEYKASDKNFVDGFLSRNAHTAIILDGLDEVTYSKAVSTVRQINRFVSKYTCQVVLTSRPQELDSLADSFIHLHASRLTLEKSRSLVQHLNIDTNLKARFLRDIDTLFDEHRQFLSNPLLLIVFLFTYREFAAIPQSLHRFFEQAFIALYNKHDAEKDGFVRRLETGFDGTRFLSATAAFSALTYAKQQHEFSSLELERFLNESKKLSNLQFDATALKNDLMVAVCLLLRDGTKIRYAHRLFQEYLTAVFFNTTALPDRDRFIQKVCRKASDTEQLLPMLFEMNQLLVERAVLLPLLTEIRSKTKYRGRVNKTVFLRFLTMQFDSVSLRTQFDDETKRNVTFSTSISSPRLRRRDLVRFVAERFGYEWKKQSREDADKEATKIAKILDPDREGRSTSRTYATRLDESSKSLAIANALMDTHGFWHGGLLKFLMDLQQSLIEKHAVATEFAFEELLGE